MIKAAEVGDYSLIMSAIKYHEENPYEHLNPRPIPSPDEPTLSQSLNVLQKHYIFGTINVSDKVGDSIPKSQAVDQGPPIYAIGYFDGEIFDVESDFPCRDLARWIEAERNPQITN